MKLLTLIIPEPWLSLGIVAAVLAAWFYGDLTGSSRQAQRDKLAGLEQTVATMKRERDAALAIQTQMATRLSEVRAESTQREKDADDLIEKLRAQPVASVCLLDDARRVRLRSIKIGPARADPAARQLRP